MSGDRCLKVFVSGQCSHPDNAADKMHVCRRPLHAPELWHTCECGKSWDDVRLTDEQYAVVAFTKAVE